MKRFITLSILSFCFAFNIFSQNVTLRPTSATINDENGRFTSQSFDCPNMTVTDNKSYIDIAVGGSRFRLTPADSGTYTSTVSKGNTKVTAVAYRSSSSNRIYLVVMTTREGNKSLTINFK